VRTINELHLGDAVEFDLVEDLVSGARAVRVRRSPRSPANQYEGRHHGTSRIREIVDATGSDILSGVPLDARVDIEQSAATRCLLAVRDLRPHLESGAGLPHPPTLPAKTVHRRAARFIDAIARDMKPPLTSRERYPQPARSAAVIASVFFPIPS
jgi:hypothetical protein